MKTKYFQLLIHKYLAHLLPNYINMKRLLYVEPIGEVLQGFFFDDSSFDKWKFVVYAFVLPLYVPTDHVSFNFGGRLGTLSGGQERWWRINEDKANETEIMQDVISLINKEALPFFEKTATPADFSNMYIHKANPPHIIIMEAVSYSLILANEYRKAEKIAIKNIRYLQQAIQGKYSHPHLYEKLARTELILKALQDNPQKAVSTLEIWRDETLVNLGLPNR